MTTRGIRCPMACAFVALFVLTRAWTNADTLILKNGNRLDGQIMASPAMADQALFLRTGTHLYRIEKQQ